MVEAIVIAYCGVIQDACLQKTGKTLTRQQFFKFVEDNTDICGKFTLPDPNEVDFERYFT